MAIPLRPNENDLALLSRMVHGVARARGLSIDDACDFAQSVQVRLLESGHAIFHRFEGGSSLKTYLHVVVSRLLKDWQNQRWGKWRPSSAAVRLGTDAVRLERLINRDGLTASEAIAMIPGSANAQTAKTLDGLLDRLPQRLRRQTVSESLLADVPGWPCDDPVERTERLRTEREVRAALRAALAQLPGEDRRLIRSRFARAMPIAAIARQAGCDQKALYRRCDRVLKTLRHELVARGVAGPSRLAGE